MDVKMTVIAVVLIAISLIGLSFLLSSKKENINDEPIISQTQNKEFGNPPTPSNSTQSIEDQQQQEEATMNTKSLPKPEMMIDVNKTYEAILKTDSGDIKISLNAKETPITVNNFVYLARNKFYDDVIFHRVIKEFMIQSGDPKGDGTGGPGYQFDDEKLSGSYTKGTVAMANAGPNTNGSQFFIMHGDNPLPPNYVIFGNVVEGLDVVDKIAEAEVKVGPSGEPSSPIAPVHIKSVEIIER